MKNIILLSFFLCIGFVGVTAQVNPDQIQVVQSDGPILELESTVVDYGTIEQNGEPLRKLKFTNTGTEPLVIKNARGSCGCTVPTWPKEPIMPGESSELEIRYATNRIGKFSKRVTLTTNEIGDPKVITVKGHVLKAEEKESAPAAAPSIIKTGGGN